MDTALASIIVPGLVSVIIAGLGLLATVVKTRGKADLAIVDTLRAELVRCQADCKADLARIEGERLAERRRYQEDRDQMIKDRDAMLKESSRVWDRLESILKRND